MKKFITVSLALCLVSLAAFAQWPPRHDNGEFNEEQARKGAERINASKVAFFTQQLDLSVEEAQKFWPVYNEYNKNVEAARNDIREAMRDMNDSQKSSAEIKAALKKYTDSQKKEAQLTESYINKLMGLLPVEKVAKVFAAEDMFRMQLLYQFRMGGPGGDFNPGDANNRQGGRNPWNRGGNDNNSNKQQ